MFFKSTVFKQYAQSPLWVRLLLAIVPSGFALLLIPFKSLYGYESLWMMGLYIITFFTISYTMGFKSWVTQDKQGNLTMSFYDKYSRTNAYLPFEYITDYQLCEYSGFQNKAPDLFKDLPFHNIYSQLLYQGKGLIIKYKIPKSVGGDDEERSWQLPAPKANEFIKLVKLNTNLPYKNA